MTKIFALPSRPYRSAFGAANTSGASVELAGHALKPIPAARADPRFVGDSPAPNPNRGRAVQDAPGHTADEEEPEKNQTEKEGHEAQTENRCNEQANRRPSRDSLEQTVLSCDAARRGDAEHLAGVEHRHNNTACILGMKVRRRRSRDGLQKPHGRSHHTSGANRPLDALPRADTPAVTQHRYKFTLVHGGTDFHD